MFQITFKNIFFFLVALTLSTQSVLATPKSLVELQPSEDRWISFADGGKLHFGFEIPYMIAAYLHQTGKYLIHIPIENSRVTNSDRNMIMSFNQSATSMQSLIRELNNRAPHINWEFLKGSVKTDLMLPQNSNELGRFRPFDAKHTNELQQFSLPRIKISSRLETLLYASGNRSNRVVLGFTPQRLNVFNAGKLGAEDNEFVAHVDPKNPSQCKVVDFFNGQLKVEGFGPSMPNFGANSDEGFAIHLFGYGFGFKKKSFELKSEIVVNVEIPHLNFKKEYRYSLKGGGKDLFIAGSYSGISVGVEIQRRNTLRKALQKMFPELLQDFESQLPSHTWQTQVLGELNGEWIIAGDRSSGVSEGLELISNLGSKYKVTYSSEDEGYSIIQPDHQNTFSPYIGETLRENDHSGTVWLQNQLLSQSQRGLAQAFENKESEIIEIEKTGLNLNDEGVNKAVEIVNNLTEKSVPYECLEKKMGYWERLVAAFSYLYGLYRYNDVLDQKFDHLPQVRTQRGDSLKIAIVSSGISPKEKSLKDHLEASGFDFYSWDNRPSDDFGAGTAAAILLKKELKRDFTLVPYKVFGAYGETNSSAIYSAFQHIAGRQDIDVVIVPFKPSIESKAYNQGVELVVQSGKKVFVPDDISVYGSVNSPVAKDKFKTKALESKVVLSPVGVGVIKKAASELQ